jgi:hypothetical protein
MPVIPRKVLVALLKPAVIASSKLFGEAAIISVTLATRADIKSPPFYVKKYLREIQRSIKRNGTLTFSKFDLECGNDGGLLLSFFLILSWLGRVSKEKKYQND